MSRVRVAWWRAVGVRIGARCRLAAIEIPRNPWDIELDAGVALDRGVVLLTTGSRIQARRIRIGTGCYINRHTMIDASEYIEIGAKTMIGPYCYITDHDHGTDANQPINEQSLRGTAVEIGHDVWIGAGVTVLKGVTIGDGAIVGAGSVVTRAVPPGVVITGVPARILRRRA